MGAKGNRPVLSIWIRRHCRFARLFDTTFTVFKFIVTEAYYLFHFFVMELVRGFCFVQNLHFYIGINPVLSRILEDLSKTVFLGQTVPTFGRSYDTAGIE